MNNNQEKNIVNSHKNNINSINSNTSNSNLNNNQHNNNKNTINDYNINNISTNVHPGGQLGQLSNQFSNTNINSRINHRLGGEEDVYTTYYVDNLLSNVNDWRNIQEIVRTSIKSLTEIVKVQGQAIHELEKQISTKSTKIELINGLGSKANINDVMRTFNEVAASIENRPTIDEVQGLVDEKVSKADVNFLINNKASIEEVRNIVSQKVESLNFKDEIQDGLDEEWEHVYSLRHVD